MRTNRLYAAVTTGWATLLAAAVFFLGLTLESTWTADHLSRSGRGLVARVACYFELYLPTAVVILWCAGLLLLMASKADWPEWYHVFPLLALETGLVGLNHRAVIRQWHPALRCTLHITFIGVGWAIWAFTSW